MAFNTGIWRPTRKQEEFLALPLTIREALYGGGAGSAKTDVLLLYGICHGWHENPAFKQVFLRRTFPELRNEVIPRSRQIYHRFGATLNKSDMAWTFPRPDQIGSGAQNAGAMIFLGQCEGEDDVHKYDSMEINLFTPDELTSITEYIYLYIGFTRVRTSDNTLPAIIRAAGMPGGLGHCVPHGEVLTPSGWIDIKDIKIDDPIYEVSPSGQLVESEVKQKHEHDYNDNLFHAKSTKIQIDCTHGHRIARKNVGKGYNNFVLTKAGCLPFQANIRVRSHYDSDGGNDIDSIKIGKYDIPYELYLDLLGWSLSEGFTLSRKGDYLFGITQTKQYNIEHINDLLIRCGIEYSYTSNSFNIYDKDLHCHFSQFGKCRDKFIPREILNGPFLNVLLDSMMAGDGHWTDQANCGYYYTTSKRLSDDFLELAIKCGYASYVTSRQRIDRSGLSYQIAINNKRDYTEIVTYGNRSNVSYKPFSGKVYDIGVPKYHTFIIRQNGYTWVSGNSWVRKRFPDAAPPGTVIRGKGQNLRIYIHATLADNPHIDPGYKQSLEALPEAEKRAKLYGDWNAYAGQVFDEFRDRNYPDEPPNALHVIPEFLIPSYWPKIVVGDWGFAAMTYVCFAAISPQRRVYIYREMYWTKTKIEEWAPYVKEYIDLENPRTVRFCRSAGKDMGAEHTIQEQISSALGRPIDLTDNSQGSRVAGKQLIHEYLRWKPKHQFLKQKAQQYAEETAMWILRNRGMKEYKSYLDSFDEPEIESNLPKLQIFESCRVLPEAIKACSYDKKKIEDIAEFAGDDPIDALRYLVDAADNYFDSAEGEFKIIQKREQLAAKLNATNDWTAFYRNMSELERNQQKPVRMFHRRRRTMA